MRRIVTGILLILAFIYLVLWAPAWLLALAGVLFSQAALWEFFRMGEHAFGAPMLRVPAHAISILLVASALTERFVEVCIGLILLLVLIVLSVAMYQGFELKRYLPIVSGTILGVIYTTVPLCIFIWIKAQPGGASLAFFVMVTVWAGDTTAYFVGRAVGSHLAFPRISPKKTWEGVAGSLAAALIVGLAGWQTFHDWTVIPFSVAINIAAQLGDLAESAMKRSVDVKDSSQLVPGHGGVLDRIDALLFAAPVLWYYWLLTGR